MSGFFRLVSGLVLLVVALVAVVLVVSPYTFLPGLVDGAVARSLQGDLGLAAPPRVELRSDPPWRMLGGDFSGGEVELGSPDLGGVRADYVRVDLDPFDVPLARALVGGDLASEEPISGTVEAAFSAEELTEAAKAADTAYPIRGISFDDEQMLIDSETQVFGIEVPVSVKGTPSIRGENFVFEPDEVRAAGVEVPQDLTRALLGGTEFSQPLEDLPYGRDVTEAGVRVDRLVVTGKVPDVTVGP